jgi:glucose/arabinose dehydrogenase
MNSRPYPALTSVVLTTVVFLLLNNFAYSQTFPAGFSRVRVVRDLTNPTAMTFLTDGRILVAEQVGRIRVVKNNTLLATPALTISVNSVGERGITGIAVDPDFSSNGYIYLYYCLPNGANNRISRFTMTGDIIDPASEFVLLNLDPLSGVTGHNAGCMRIYGGKLYVSIGENAMAALSQSLDSYMGKLIRINLDGSAPADNPFPNGTAKGKRIWAYGLRNPFTFDIQQTTGKIYINDVGGNTWEEINDATIGGTNLGWPNVEGIGSNPAYANPVFNYAHGNGDGIGCAITGGVFFTPPVSTNYPSTYIGKYFYLDYCQHWINYLDINAGTVTRRSFGTGVGNNLVGLNIGRDGTLHYLDRGLGAIYKVVYSGPNGAPTIANQPQALTVAAGQPATFSVTATGANLTYQWQKNGNPISGANGSSYTINPTVASDAGGYRVVVSNTAGSVTSVTVQLTVTAFNAPPVAEILTPANGTLYTAGETISFSGNGTDPETGTLPASAFSWSVVFHHDTHVHDGPPIATGVKGGTYTIPTIGETADNVWYQLYLVVTDAVGLKDTTFIELQPRKSNINLVTEPTGLQVTMDGQPVVAPYSDLSVEGVQRVIGVVSPQALAGQNYAFDRWTHGGEPTQIIFTPADDATYTAIYVPTGGGGLREPENPPLTQAGLTYYYYEGTWTALPDFNTLTIVKSGLLATPNLWPKRVEDNYAFQFRGYIDIPADGTWTFYTSSDEGSQLWIGSTVVVDNDGLHAAQEASGTIGLKKGKHAFNLTYFENVGAASLAVRWKGPGINKQVIGSSAYYRIPTSGAAGAREEEYSEPMAVEVPAVYPNPAQYNINVEVIAEIGEPIELSLVNIHGQEVKQQAYEANTSGSNILTLPVEDIGNGMYQIKVKKGYSYQFKKVMIRK